MRGLYLQHRRAGCGVALKTQVLQSLFNGLTQKDVSEMPGVTQQTYARLEANPASASIERLLNIKNKSLY